MIIFWGTMTVSLSESKIARAESFVRSYSFLIEPRTRLTLFKEPNGVAPPARVTADSKVIPRDRETGPGLFTCPPTITLPCAFIRVA